MAAPTPTSAMPPRMSFEWQPGPESPEFGQTGRRRLVNRTTRHTTPSHDLPIFALSETREADATSAMELDLERRQRSKITIETSKHEEQMRH